MGRAIFYCTGCSQRLTDDDFAAGKALKIRDRIVCSKCATDEDKAQAAAASRPSGATTRVSAKAGTGVRPAVRAPLPPARESSTRTPLVAGEQPAGPGKRLVVLGAAGGGTLLLLAVLGVVLFRGRPAAAPPASPDRSSSSAGVQAPRRTPRDIHAEHELAKARDLAKANPDDLALQLMAFTEVVFKFDGTESGAAAKAEVVAIKGKVGERVAAAAKGLEEEVKGSLERKDFEAAVAILEKAMSRLPFVEWTGLVGKRIEETRVLARARRKELEEAAAAVPAQPGVPADPVPVPTAGAEAPPSAEAKAYRVSWEGAMAKATARDFAAAVAALKKVAGALTEADAKREAERDLADLAKVEALHQAAREAWLKKPRGAAVSLDVREGGGEPRRVSGILLRVDADRVEIRESQGPRFVEWGEATPASIARAVKGADPRALLIAGILEGDLPAEAAVEAKWKGYAADARARIPKVDGAERSARELFYAAEREYRSSETLLQAAEKYASLKNDFPTSSVTRAYLSRILRRSDAGREYYFRPADFAATGTFKLSKEGKLESVKDSDPDRAIDNTASLEFSARPGAAYRLWLFAGACCEETFTLLWQATELTDVHPKTRKKVSCEPGGNFAAELKLPVKGLKKTHALHSPKKEPKRPDRWEWVEVKLPRYSGPGPKKIVFMTDQSGFAIGGAFISALAAKPPGEADVKEWERRRLEDEPPLVVDPDLVGWWTFDEGAGAAAGDSSGNGREVLLDGATRAPGILGGALKFEGGAVGTRIAHHEDFNLAGDFTIALWVRKDAECVDWARIVGKGSGGERTFGIWEWPGADKRIKFQQSGAGKWFDIDGARPLELGKWTHLAVTFQGNRGALYIDGQKDGEKDRVFKAAVGNWPVTLGNAPMHSNFIGAIDDLRFYKRVLGLDEIAEIVRQAR